jgi:two-component system, cell cycle sensor histidine kinase and response regulator CckA
VDRDPQRSSPTNQRLSAQGTFLIVEDEQLMLRLMAKLLRNHGYRVLTAADGEEAIEIYRRHKQEIDVVLLDMGLPKMTGWEVLLQMKDENPAVRVVIASGYLEPEAKNKMYGAGIKHFVSKPYMPEEVVKTLQSFMPHR